MGIQGKGSGCNPRKVFWTKTSHHISTLGVRAEALAQYQRSKEAKKKITPNLSERSERSRLQQTCTTWPSFPFTCRLLFNITTRKSVNSRQFYLEELFSAVFSCSLLVLNISQLESLVCRCRPLSIVRARKRGLRLPNASRHANHKDKWQWSIITTKGTVGMR